jgi:hypothetical protein
MARMLGEGSVKAAGQVYTLRFDMNVLADLEEETGLKPVKLMTSLQDEGGSVMLIRKVCHAMLKRHHPLATIDVAGDILAEDMEGLMAVITAAMPPQAKGQPGNGDATAGQPT